MEKVSETILAQRAFFARGETRENSFRRKGLKALATVLTKSRKQILCAMCEDFQRPAMEMDVSEILPVLWEIEIALKHLDQWTRPQKHSVARINRPGSARTLRQPFGIALIIGPWNYPLGLLLTPLVSSMAAGNCTILKSSEHCPRTSQLIRELLCAEFDPAYISVMEGGPDIVINLLRAGVDFIFFTGGKESGRAVMAEAAQRTTPMVLELGGKNPCIIDKGMDLSIVARRVAWGKFFNAGQTCIAPDYCLVHRDAADSFINEMIAAIHKFYGLQPHSSTSYGRIINAHHFDRLVCMLNCGRVICGGTYSRGDLYIAPTLLRDVSPESPLLTEEIFGPLFPVVIYETIQDALAFISNRPSLACYCFTQDRNLMGMLEQNLRTGNLCFNGTLHLMITKGVPFGGVGPSGFGRYHGKAGFDAFSYEKAVLQKSARYEFPVVYPPYRTPLGVVNALRKLLF